jgi:catechol 2,3-dioxygenase-like lactoylglutathione lyase family enzyme
MSFYNGIVTAKLQESRDFYTQHLGFTVKFENEWFVLLERGGRELAFMLPGLQSQNEIFRDEYPGRGTWLTIEVDDVSAEYERMKKDELRV